jgi:hypothetical protein
VKLGDLTALIIAIANAIERVKYIDITNRPFRSSVRAGTASRTLHDCWPA